MDLKESNTRSNVNKTVGVLEALREEDFSRYGALFSALELHRSHPVLNWVEDLPPLNDKNVSKNPSLLFQNCVEKMETDDFFSNTLIKILKTTRGKELQS